MSACDSVSLKTKNCRLVYIEGINQICLGLLSKKMFSQPTLSLYSLFLVQKYRSKIVSPRLRRKTEERSVPTAEVMWKEYFSKFVDGNITHEYSRRRCQ